MIITIDSREQAPFSFLNCAADVETVKGTLQVGDYSLAGLETKISVERKSLPDLVMCLGQERERFERELLRAAALEAFAVVVEATWQDLIGGKYRSKLNPGAAAASVASFMSRYRIAFFFAGNRSNAERFTEGYLRQFLKSKQHELHAIVKQVGKIFT